MSKSDALRAMREAKYAANEARLRAKPVHPTVQKAPVAGPPAVVIAAPAPAEVAVAEVAPAEVAPAASAGPAAEEACGHRNMSGRTCTRERGHAAKSHRYS